MTQATRQQGKQILLYPIKHEIVTDAMLLALFNNTTLKGWLVHEMAMEEVLEVAVTVVVPGRPSGSDSGRGRCSGSDSGSAR